MGNNKFLKNCLLTAVLIIAMAAFLLITGCARADEDSIIEIGERMFMTQIQDIYLNANNFVGRTIRLEGIFNINRWNESFWYFVIRNGPDGCCGTPGQIGFEVRWPENRIEAFPENDSWVEATGVLRTYRDGPNQFLYLELTSLRVLNTRGLEFVER